MRDQSRARQAQRSLGWPSVSRLRFPDGSVRTGGIAAGSGTCGDPTVTGERVKEDFELVHCLLPRRYVDFFLLQDLVSEDHSKVRSLTPFDNFTPPALPENLDAYVNYRVQTTQFVAARNVRIGVATR